MAEQGFHFAAPVWLWGLAALPLVIAWLWSSAPQRRRGREDGYADPELLPHLVGSASAAGERSLQPLLLWSLLWVLLILAMAGPRWDYQQLSPFRPAADLVVVLDISRSMNIKDTQPSRMERAKQEIQDLVRRNPGVRIGLVAFATLAHVVTPLTEDGKSLLHALPALSPELVRLPGSRIGDALERARQLLASSSADTGRHILLVTDGDFADQAPLALAEELRQQGIVLHVLGIGTPEGGPVPPLPGMPMLGPNGLPLVSRLEAAELEALAAAGGGLYQQADYRADDTDAVVQAVLQDAETRRDAEHSTRVWWEAFHWLLLPAALLLLFFSRREGGLVQLARGRD
jgi:Ca-activated chloride channel family protein